MFMRFFTELREAKVPVTLKEYLILMEAMDKGSSTARSTTSITCPARPW